MESVCALHPTAAGVRADSDASARRLRQTRVVAASLDLPEHPAALAMLAVGGGVGVAAAVAPTLLLRAFGVPAAEVNGAARMGWRLFAARNLYLTARALRGHPDGLAAYAPLQALDQVVFWHAFATRSVPRGTAVAAAGASALIVALDLARRSAEPAPTRWSRN